MSSCCFAFVFQISWTALEAAFQKPLNQSAHLSACSSYSSDLLGDQPSVCPSRSQITLYVAPHWPHAKWYPSLLTLLVMAPKNSLLLNSLYCLQVPLKQNSILPKVLGWHKAEVWIVSCWLSLSSSARRQLGWERWICHNQSRLHCQTSHLGALDS